MKATILLFCLSLSLIIEESFAVECYQCSWNSAEGDDGCNDPFDKDKITGRCTGTYCKKYTIETEQAGSRPSVQRQCVESCDNNVDQVASTKTTTTCCNNENLCNGASRGQVSFLTAFLGLSLLVVLRFTL